MGEMANDAVEGACCSWCGTYFDGDHGYPVLCTGCWKEIAHLAKGGMYEGLQKAHLEELS